MTYASIKHELDQGSTVILDGAMGTELSVREGPLAWGIWGCAANVETPDLVRAIHLDYIEAGADVITTNTFDGTRANLALGGLAERTPEINRAAVRLAKEAVERSGAGRSIAIAGSLSPVSSGAQASLTLAAAAEAYREQASLLAEAGVDLIALEMLQDHEHAPLAIEAATATGLPVWLGLSCALAEGGGGPVLKRAGGAAGLAQSLDLLLAIPGIDAVTIMHTHVDDTGPALDVLGGRWGGPTGAYPHFGRFQEGGWSASDVPSPATFVQMAAAWHGQGARIIGSCCGMGPAYTRALAARFAGR